jgi:hypothetical protein
MRTIDEFREYKLGILKAAILHPSMWGDPWVWAEVFLRDLCFIDEREEDFKLERERLIEQKRFPPTGPYGPLQVHLSKPGSVDPRFFNEVASVYGELARKLGYLEVDRALSDEEFGVMREQLRQFQEGNWHQSDIAARFGKPSLMIGGNHQRCYCYAPLARSGDWIFFDFEFHEAAYDDIKVDKSTGSRLIDGVSWWEHPDCSNPPLRNVREPGAGVLSGFIFTPYGRRIQEKFKQDMERAFPER